jgi:Ser/Thr protein kinase RdoA (MazF antagonist)
MDIQVLIAVAAFPDLEGRTTIWPLTDCGGFSGVQLWRLTTPRGEFLLRCWPSEQTEGERLRWVHAAIHFAATHGFPRLADPLPTHQGDTLLWLGQRFWEAAPWLAGEADFRQSPRLNKLRAAAVALAEFHVAIAGFEPDTAKQPMPGIRERNVRIRQWIDGRLDQLQLAVEQAVRTASEEDELPQLARQILASAPAVMQVILDSLTSAMTCRQTLQPCLRDIWYQHVLFQGDEVTGLIDYGALRRDSIATDIARLIGSLAGDETIGWQAGLDAYQTVRRLSPMERGLVAAYDLSSILLAPLNWLDWLYLEQRSFRDPVAVLERLRELSVRLRRLHERLDERLDFPHYDQTT